jgi:hypothetical protein
MVELTVPFWLTSAVLADDQSVNDWLKSQRIQARWIDEIVRISGSGSEGALAVDGIGESVSQLLWPRELYSESLYFQSACREIAVDDRRMILLLADSGQQRTAVLLAAPAAVGMYNLMPQAYVEEFMAPRLSADAGELMTWLDSFLLKHEKKPTQVKELLLVQSIGRRPVKAETAFSAAGWVKTANAQAGALSACHDLVQALLTRQQSNGLAVEVAADRQLFINWIERV